MVRISSSNCDGLGGTATGLCSCSKNCTAIFCVVPAIWLEQRLQKSLVNVIVSWDGSFTQDTLNRECYVKRHSSASCCCYHQAVQHFEWARCHSKMTLDIARAVMCFTALTNEGCWTALLIIILSCLHFIHLLPQHLQEANDLCHSVAMSLLNPCSLLCYLWWQEK